MAGTYRDMTVPYSEAEIEEFRRAFKAIPTYTPEDGGTVSVDEMPAVMEAMSMEGNPAQVQVYKDYWIKYFNGRIHLDKLVNIAENLHKCDAHLKSLAQNCDKDGDGFITKEEFADLLNLMVIHNSELAKFKTSFETFLGEADVNNDGKVSVEECGAWLQVKAFSI